MAGTGLAPLAAVLLSAAAAVAVLFAALAPEPYMDEPFHVPQTQRYCAGRWAEWDPKITTFPGLYLFGTALGRLVHAAQTTTQAAAQRLAGWPPPGAPAPELCSTTALRAVNLLFGAACLPLFHAAAAALDRGRSRQQLLLLTAACYLFPLHFFFNFLYYTDVPSLFFTLAAYLASARRRPYLSAALGAAAVLLRQTNAVWVAFTLAASVLQRCLPEHGAAGGASGASKRGGSSKRGGGSSSSSAASGELSAAATLLRDAVALPRRAWALRQPLVLELWPMAAVVAAFAAFVALNGGIVVGDRSHHAPVRHWAQPLYCLLYCTTWLAPAFWTPPALARAAATLGAGLRRRPARTVAGVTVAAAVAAAAVRWGTLAHPFLLADNRHYPFYLWRRLLNRTPWARYALLHAYLYSAWAAGGALAHRGPLWVALLAGGTCAVLVPAHLLEFRYFSVPFYLLLLHMRTPSPRALAAAVALFAAADAATLSLFLFRPFAWPDGSVARFLW